MAVKIYTALAQGEKVVAEVDRASAWRMSANMRVGYLTRWRVRLCEIMCFAFVKTKREVLGFGASFATAFGRSRHKRTWLPLSIPRARCIVNSSHSASCTRRVGAFRARGHVVIIVITKRSSARLT